jgi:hypothetical protein
VLQLTGNTIRFLHNYLPINVTVLQLAYVAGTPPAILGPYFAAISPSAELSPRPCTPEAAVEE